MAYRKKRGIEGQTEATAPAGAQTGGATFIPIGDETFMSPGSFLTKYRGPGGYPGAPTDPFFDMYGGKPGTIDLAYDDWRKDVMLWTTGFVGGFSLAGFGAASWGVIGSTAGFGLGSQIGAAVAVTGLSTTITEVADQSLSSSSATAFTGGQFWGGISAIAMNVVGMLRAPGAGMTTGEVIEDMAIQSDAIGVWEPGVGYVDPDVGGYMDTSSHPGFIDSILNYFRW